MKFLVKCEDCSTEYHCDSQAGAETMRRFHEREHEDHDVTILPKEM